MKGEPSTSQIVFAILHAFFLVFSFSGEEHVSFALTFDRAGWFFGDTLGLSAHTIRTFGDVDGRAVVKQLAEAVTRHKREPAAERLIVAVLQAGKLVGGEVRRQVEAVGAFSKLKAAIIGSQILAAD